MCPILLVFVAIALSAAAAPGDLGDSLAAPVDHPAVGYFNYLNHSGAGIPSSSPAADSNGVLSTNKIEFSKRQAEPGVIMNAATNAPQKICD